MPLDDAPRSVEKEGNHGPVTLGDADDAFLHTNALTIRSGYEHAATALAELAVIVSEDGMIDIRTNRLLVQ